MNMGERLKKLRLQKGATQEEVGKIINVSKATIMKYEKGLVENLKRSSIEKLAKYFGVAPSYLMCLDESKEKVDELGNPVALIPILGTVKAGYDYMAQENWEGTIDLNKKIADTGEFFALKVKGDSMVPVFFEGDTIIIRKQNYCKDNEVAVVIINGNEGTLKKVKKQENGIKLIPFNRTINPETGEPYYEDLYFTEEQIKETPIIIAGVFHEMRRDEIKF